MARAFRAASRVLGGKRSKRAKNQLVSSKIRVLRREGTPEKQAVATALSMQRAGRLRPGGVYVRAKAKP